MKRKRFWIIFSSVCLGLIILCTIFALVFRLKTVDVEIRSRETQASTNLGADIKQRVLETGEFDFGKNILFMNFKDNIEKIEKSNPFVKVEQVVRHFPNIVRVYISEREPKYRVKESSEQTENWYILDDEFKILDKVSETELETKKISGTSCYFDQTIEITKETCTLSASAIIGEFVEDKLSTYLSDITAGFYGKTKDYTAIRMIDYSEINGKFIVTMRNEGLKETNDAKGCNIVFYGTTDLYKKALSGAVAFIEGQEIESGDGRIENIPEEIIEIKQDADGKYYAVS